MIKYLFLNNFVNIREYSWIPADMKKLDGYPHNGYPTDMGTGTRQIFIQRVGYGRAITRTLYAPLTSLHITYDHRKWIDHKQTQKTNFKILDLICITHEPHITFNKPKSKKYHKCKDPHNFYTPIYI